MISIIKPLRSEPESSGFLEERDQSPIDMWSHDTVHWPHELPPDEHHRHRRRVPQQPHQRPLNLLPSGVLVQLVHSRVHAHSAEEPLHGMAHAAGAEAEDHHRILRRQPRHSLQRIRHDSRRRCRCRRIVSPRFGVVVVHLNSTGGVERMVVGKRSVYSAGVSGAFWWFHILSLCCRSACLDFCLKRMAECKEKYKIIMIQWL